MDASTRNNNIRRDSGLALEDDTKFYKGQFELLNYVVAGDNVASDPSVVNQYYNRDIIKRSRSDTSLYEAGSSEPTAKKRKVNRPNLYNGDGPRVMCPFYKMNSEQYERTVSCHNTGYDALSRLKQHLRKVHNVEESKLKFKSQNYRNLGTMEAKWTKLFVDLFPGRDIPSPYKEESSISKPTVAASVSSAELRAKFESTLAQDGADPALYTKFMNMFDKSLENIYNNGDTPQKQFGLLTPPSSTECSPEISKKSYATPHPKSPTELTATPTFSDGDVVDPVLFPSPIGVSGSLFDSSTDMNSTWKSENITLHLAQQPDMPNIQVPQSLIFLPSFEMCLDCASTNTMTVPSAFVGQELLKSTNLELSQGVSNLPTPTAEWSFTTIMEDSSDLSCGADSPTLEAQGVSPATFESCQDLWTTEEYFEGKLTDAEMDNLFGDVDKLFQLY